MPGRHDIQTTIRRMIGSSVKAVAAVEVVAAVWAVAAVATSGTAFAQAVPPAMIPAQPYLSFEVRDSVGRTIQAYLSEAGDARALPLVLYVQGSGARSHFVRRPDGRVAGGTGHSTIHDVFGDAARVLLVEKPGVHYLDDPPSVEAASREFHREHTLERWTLALRAAIRAACARSDIACGSGLLVIGHSEGGVVAARVAATFNGVTHVALLAGEGPSQLYSLLALARAGDLFASHGATATEREAYVLAQWQQILRDPDAADRFFFGHPYRRWSTFLGTSPAAELPLTSARILIAQGGADRAVAPESADMLFAALTARGRDVCYHRVPDADHSFARASTDGWKDVMEEVRDWFLGRPAADRSRRTCSISN